MTNISETVQYPTTSDEWTTTILIGGVLTFLGVFLIPLFLVYGYLIKIIRTNHESPTPPGTFEDWGSLFIDGLQTWIISILYFLIPIIIGAATIGWSVLLLATGTPAGTIGGIGGLLAGALITSILFLLFAYVAVAGIVNFAIKKQFTAAFDIETLKTVGLNSDYAIAWLLSVIVFFVAGLVNLIPFIGWFLSPFAWFYAAIVSAKLWVDGFETAIA